MGVEPVTPTHEIYLYGSAGNWALAASYWFLFMLRQHHKKWEIEPRTLKNAASDDHETKPREYVIGCLI